MLSPEKALSSPWWYWHPRLRAPENLPWKDTAHPHTLGTWVPAVLAPVKFLHPSGKALFLPKILENTEVPGGAGSVGLALDLTCFSRGSRAMEGWGQKQSKGRTRDFAGAAVGGVPPWPPRERAERADHHRTKLWWEPGLWELQSVHQSWAIGAGAGRMSRSLPESVVGGGHDTESVDSRVLATSPRTASGKCVDCVRAVGESGWPTCSQAPAPSLPLLRNLCTTSPPEQPEPSPPGLALLSPGQCSAVLALQL